MNLILKSDPVYYLLFWIILYMVFILSYGVAVYFLNKRKEKEEEIYFLGINPNINVIKNPLFWISIITPFIVFIALGLRVWIDYDLSLTSIAYDEFYKISKVPIAILALAIPFGIMVTRIHASEQTARQIDIQIKINDASIERQKENAYGKSYISIIQTLDLCYMSLIAFYGQCRNKINKNDYYGCSEIKRSEYILRNRFESILGFKNNLKNHSLELNSIVDIFQEKEMYVYYNYLTTMLENYNNLFVLKLNLLREEFGLEKKIFPTGIDVEVENISHVLIMSETILHDCYELIKSFRALRERLNIFEEKRNKNKDLPEGLIKIPANIYINEQPKMPDPDLKFILSISKEYNDENQIKGIIEKNDLSFYYEDKKI